MSSSEYSKTENEQVIDTGFPQDSPLNTDTFGAALRVLFKNVRGLSNSDHLDELLYELDAVDSG